MSNSTPHAAEGVTGATRLSTGQIQQIFDRSPFIASMRMNVVSLDYDTETLTVEVPFQPQVERGPDTGQWHGGPLAAIIDTVGDFAVGMMVGRGLPTINFRVDYLRPAIHTHIRAVAKVRRNGKTVGVADVDLFNDKGVLLAIGRASYATLPTTT